MIPTSTNEKASETVKKVESFCRGRKAALLLCVPNEEKVDAIFSTQVECEAQGCGDLAGGLVEDGV